jgi:RNA-binding protein
MPAPLTAAQKRHLRALAHPLKPVVLLGAKGLTDPVVAEVDGALEHHELIKVKMAADDRAARDAAIAELARRCGAELVQRVGHTATLYRRSREQPQIVLPR